MSKIICSICGREFEGGDQPDQDNSTFICEDCQNQKNLKAWKDELAKLMKKKEANSAELRRVDFLKAKVSSLETE